MEQIESHISSKASYEIHQIDVSSGVSIRGIVFTPQSPISDKEIIFVPGWISTLNSWRHFLEPLTQNFKVIYIETREKSTSSIANSKTGITVQDISQDILQAIDYFKPQKFFLAGSSLGATAILDNPKAISSKADGLILILPNAKFYLPRFIPLILKTLPKRFLPLLKHFVKYAMIKYRINPDDLEHKNRFLYSLNQADLIKLRNSALAIYDYQLNYENLRMLELPTLVIGASNDKEHNQRDIRKISQIIPQAKFIDLKTFTATHSSKASKMIIDFISGIENHRRDK